MVVKQLAVFMENAPGRLKALTEVIAQQNINMRAITIADTSDFGIVRMIVDDNEKAVAVLQENNFVAKLTSVLAVEVGDEPGQLLTILGVLDTAKINIEYMYAFKVSHENKALMIFKVDQEPLAIQTLKDNGYVVYENQEQMMSAF